MPGSASIIAILVRWDAGPRSTQDPKRQVVGIDVIIVIASVAIAAAGRIQDAATLAWETHLDDGKVRLVDVGVTIGIRKRVMARSATAVD